MRRMTRREMLKLTALGLGSLAFRLPDSLQAIDLTSPKRLPVFPDVSRLGRVTQPGIALRSRPSNSEGDQNVILRLPADTLVVWEREVVGTVVGGPGYLRYIETPEGYIYGGMIQPVGNQNNGQLQKSRLERTGSGRK